MAEVYQNAVLTISADGAEDSSVGLFAASQARPANREAEIQSPLLTGDKLKDHFRIRKTDLNHRKNDVHHISNARKWRDQPLQHRGWALQEWLLSRRVVSDSKYGMKKIIC